MMANFTGVRWPVGQTKQGGNVAQTGTIPENTHYEEKARDWMGFACVKCGTPLAVERSNSASKSGQPAARGWRVTCTGCGATEYYAPKTPMVKIAISK
jgi:hypothetical protein